MEGAKISKSAGRFPLLDDLVVAGLGPLAFRLLCFGAKYRSELAFTLEAVRAAQRNLDYLFEFVRSLREEAVQAAADNGWAFEFGQRFHEAINNDLNTPQALAITLELVAESYRRRDQCIWNTLKGFDQILGLNLEEHLRESREAMLPAEVMRLRDEREQARRARDFQRADQLRRELDARGYEVRDNKTGPATLRLKRAAP
jgi:cysteinyl-tRNA synthetase